MSTPVSAAGVKTARMTATRDQHAAGSLEITTSADAVLATFTLSASGGTSTSGVWTIQFGAGTGSATVAATATGTAAKCRLKNSGDTILTTGLTVGLADAGVIIDNTSINSGQNVTIQSATVTHA